MGGRCLVGHKTLAVSLLGVLCSGRAHAASSDSRSDETVSMAPESLPFLTWRAPESCPQRAQVVEQIEGLLEQDLPSEMPLTAQATIWPVGGFRLELILRNEEEVGTRELDFATCEDAANFVALSIALALGSGHIGSGGAEPPEGAGGSEALGPVDQDAISSDSSGSPAVSAQSAPPPADSPPEPAVTPFQNSEVSNDPGASAYDRGSSQRLAARTAWFADGALAFTSGLLPKVGVGAVLGGGIEFGLWSVRGESSFFPLNSMLPSGAQNRVDFGALTSHVSACRLVSTELFALRLCAGTELALIFAEERMDDDDRAPYSGTGASLGFVGGLEGLFRLRARLSGQIQAKVVYPMVADRFSLSDHSRVFEPQPGFRGTFGLRYFF